MTMRARKHRARNRSLAAFGALALVVASCGDDSDDDADPATDDTPTQDIGDAPGIDVEVFPENADAFSALEVPLLPISHEGCLFAAPQIPRFDRTSARGLPSMRSGSMIAASG
jgi:hypothetical protein